MNEYGEECVFSSLTKTHPYRGGKQRNVSVHRCTYGCGNNVRPAMPKERDRHGNVVGCQDWICPTCREAYRGTIAADILLNSSESLGYRAFSDLCDSLSDIDTDAKASQFYKVHLEVK